MYKRACLFLLLASALFNALKPMDLFLKPALSGCRPLEIVTTLWCEYKPFVYSSAAVLIGGFFIYDFMRTRQRIQQLEDEVAQINANKTTTAMLAEIGNVATRVDEFEKHIKKIDDDLNYLWKFIFTSRKITEYNEIENHKQPFVMRPHIPQFDGFTIRDIIKEVCSLSSNELPDSFRMRSIAMPSPRRQSPLPKSTSPVLVSHSPVSSPSSSDEEEGLKRSKTKRKNSADAMNSKGRKSPPNQKSSPRKKGDD